MKYLALIVLASGLVAQETPKVPVAPALSSAASKSIMVIDPKARANDFLHVFDLLRRDKPTLKIMVRTVNGITLSNVTEMTASPGGTLLMVKVAGNKYQMLPVEDVEEINYSP